jgi:hypothetical protein
MFLVSPLHGIDTRRLSSSGSVAGSDFLFGFLSALLDGSLLRRVLALRLVKHLPQARIFHRLGCPVDRLAVRVAISQTCRSSQLTLRTAEISLLGARHGLAQMLVHFLPIKLIGWVITGMCCTGNENGTHHDHKCRYRHAQKSVHHLIWMAELVW